MDGLLREPLRRPGTVAALTRENMMHHEATHRKNGVACERHAGERALVAEIGIFRIGGELNASPKSNSKTCGMALAMAAIFCYFPGISMMVSVAYVGFTNKSVVGIVFTTFAVALSVISVVVCFYGRLFKNKYRTVKTTASPKPSVAEDASARAKKKGANAKRKRSTQVTSRDELIVKDEPSSSRHGPNPKRHERAKDPALEKKIADSFSLQRYFANISTATGPFDLNHEEMDRLTAIAIRGKQAPQRLQEGKGLQSREYYSSTDSAIDVESDFPSLEAVCVV